MIELMGNDPFHFVLNHNENDLNKLSSFVHRTFNGSDFKYFIKSLKNIYLNHGGLECAFSSELNTKRLDINLHNFKNIFFELKHEKRSEKHVSDPLKGSAAKRLNMFLRWMVRSSNKGVDFGIWNRLNTRQLSCPFGYSYWKYSKKTRFIKA